MDSRPLALSAALAVLALGCGRPALRLDGTSEDSSTSQSAESSSTESSGETETTETETAETETAESETETGEAAPCPTVLQGMIEINDQSDLDSFACLERAEWLYIEGSMTDLSFLSSLEQVGILHLRSMPELVSLAGLDALTELGELWLIEAPELVDLAALPPALEFDELHLGWGNESLAEIAMPAGGATRLLFHSWDRSELELLLSASPAPTSITIYRADVLEDLDDIAACCLEQQAELRLTLHNTPLVDALQGLEPFTELHAFTLGRNPGVTSLAGLQNLERADQVRIHDDCGGHDGPGQLVDLQGLEQLSEVDYFEVSYQDSLTSLTGLPTTLAVGLADFFGNEALDAALIQAWIAAAEPVGFNSCDNLNGTPCEGICPQ